MSTADFLIGQMVGENEFNAMSFDPNHHRSFVRSLQQYLNDYDGTDQELAYPLLHLAGADKHDGGLLDNELKSTHADFYSSNTGHQYPPTAMDQVYETITSSLSLDSPTQPSGELALKPIPKDAKKWGTKSKKKAATKKQNPLSEKPTKDAPKSRRLSKRATTKSDDNRTKEPKEPKFKDRRKGSMERNRLAASKCRKRKKQWTEDLEQKKSGLEAVHSGLQAEYMNLLQESSQVKNFLIGHAQCQDPNIEVWIKNEASKYVHNLHSLQERKSLCSVLSLDGNGFTVRHSASTSAAIGSQRPPGRESQDLNSNVYSDEDEFKGDEEF